MSSAARSKEKQLLSQASHAYYLALSSLNLTPYFLDLARCISQFQRHLFDHLVNIHITGTLTTISQNSQIPGICPGLKVGWRWGLILEVTKAFYVMLKRFKCFFTMELDKSFFSGGAVFNPKSIALSNYYTM